MPSVVDTRVKILIKSGLTLMKDLLHISSFISPNVFYFLTSKVGVTYVNYSSHVKAAVTCDQ